MIFKYGIRNVACSECCVSWQSPGGAVLMSAFCVDVFVVLFFDPLSIYLFVLVNTTNKKQLSFA